MHVSSIIRPNNNWYLFILPCTLIIYISTNKSRIFFSLMCFSTWMVIVSKSATSCQIFFSPVIIIIDIILFISLPCITFKLIHLSMISTSRHILIRCKFFYISTWSFISFFHNLFPFPSIQIPSSSYIASSFCNIFSHDYIILESAI